MILQWCISFLRLLLTNLLYTTKSKIRILTAISNKHVMKIRNILVISDIGGQTVGVSDQNFFSYTIRYH